MTVSSTTSSIIYVGDGLTTVFDVPFRFLEDSDLQLSIQESDGSVNNLVLNSDYTVTGANADGGGKVYLTHPAPAQSKLSILRIMDLLQETDYRENERFPAESHERALDKLTFEAQQLQAQLDRAIKIDVFSDVDPDVLRQHIERVWESCDNIDTVADDITNVDTVSSNISDVNTTATNIADINTNADNITDINTNASNITDITTTASHISAVETVSDNITDVSNVSNSIGNVNTVANDISNVNTVSSNISDVNTVVGISTDVSAVAGISTQVDAVADNKTNIDTVAGISSDVTTVAGISGDVTSVSGISSDVTSVAGNATNINTVADISSKVSTVAAISSDVTEVAGIRVDVQNVSYNSSAVTTAADNIAAIQAAPTAASNAAGSALAASGSAAEAQQWAIGEPSEPSGGSAKYWAGQAAAGQVQADWNEADNTSKAYINNKPTIGNGTLTIEVNSTSVCTFSANQTTNETVNITIPNITVDNTTINKNNSNELQTIAVKNRRDMSTLPIWHGTQAQWTNGEPVNWYNWITDSTVGNFTEAITENTGPTTTINLVPVFVGDRILIKWLPGYIYESVDGINLSALKINNKSVVDITYGKGKYVAITSYQGSYEAYISTDFTNWTKTADLSRSYQNLIFALNRFFAVAPGSTAVSDNGIDWTEGTSNLRPSNVSFYLNAVGDKLLFFSSHDVWSSSDGFAWSNVTFPNYYYVTQNPSCGVAGTSCFVLLFNSSAPAHRRIYTTSDGVNWDYTVHDELSSNARIVYFAGCFWAIDYKTVSGTTTNYLMRANTLNNTFVTVLNPSLYKSGGFYGFIDKLVICSGGSSGFKYKFNYVPVTFGSCYTAEADPTTSSVVYSAPNTASALTISSVTTGAIMLSDSNTYYRNQTDDTQTYITVGAAHPEYLCFIDGVGIKKGNTMIADLTSV